MSNEQLYQITLFALRTWCVGKQAPDWKPEAINFAPQWFGELQRHLIDRSDASFHPTNLSVKEILEICDVNSRDVIWINQTQVNELNSMKNVDCK